jgi:hypothetical protein
MTWHQIVLLVGAKRDWLGQSDFHYDAILPEVAQADATWVGSASE